MSSRADYVCVRDVLRYLHAGMWIGRAGTINDVLSDAARHIELFSATAAPTDLADETTVRAGRVFVTHL